MIGGLEGTHEELAESSRPPRQRVALSGRLLRENRDEETRHPRAICQFFKIFENDSSEQASASRTPWSPLPRFMYISS